MWCTMHAFRGWCQGLGCGHHSGFSIISGKCQGLGYGHDLGFSIISGKCQGLGCSHHLGLSIISFKCQGLGCSHHLGLSIISGKCQGLGCSHHLGFRVLGLGFRRRCTAGLTQHLMHCVNTGSWAGERGSNIAMVFKRFVENDKGEGRVHKFTVHLVRGSCLRTPP